MNKNWVNIVIKYAVTAVIGWAFAYFVLWINDYKSITDEVQSIKVWSDAMTVPGMILIMLGFLVKISRAGALSGLSYTLRRLVLSLIPGGRMQKDENYYDYLQRKQSQPKGSVLHFFVVGGVYMVIAIVMIIRFYQVRG